MDTPPLASYATAAAVLFSVAAVTLAWLLRWRRKTFDFFRGTGISGPRPSLISGNFYHFWHKDTLDTMETWHKKYGDIYGMFNGDAPFVMVKDIDLLRRVFVSDFALFTDRGTVWRMMNENPACRNSVTMTRGESWRPVRKCISQAFTASKLRSFVPGMVEAVDHFLALLEESGSHEEQIDICSYLNAVTFDIVAKTTFGMHLDVQDNHKNALFEHAVGVVPGVSSTFFRTVAQFFSGVKGLVPLMLKLDRWFGYDAFQELANCCRPAVEARRSNPELKRPDVLQSFVETEFDKGHLGIVQSFCTKEEWEEFKDKDRIVMPISDIAANAANIVQAGFETTAVTLSHCLFCVAKFQEVQDKIRSEIKAALEKHGEFNYEAISDLQYTAQTLLETLRMYTTVPAFTSRLASCDYRYESLLIPKGASVMACSHQVHHDSNVWERPEEFNPDRFSPEEKASRDPVAFQAYGIGPRNCVGMKLAQLQMTLILAKLVHRFRLHLGSKHENGELKRQMYSIIACPVDGVWIRLENLSDGS
ncbi:hypothetical protein V5799_002698 [Amblyomma americanum]|uniref:Cytochrome n=1 Tax=Amblyomma americanum TaxID=6943 RepID=A0AAQ4DB26_AMBAM